LRQNDSFFIQTAWMIFQRRNNAVARIAHDRP